MPTQYKSAGEALNAAYKEVCGADIYNSPWEEIAQTFLRSEWGESETLCSECGQRGTHRTEECPFPKTPLLFREMENGQSAAMSECDTRDNFPGRCSCGTLGCCEYHMSELAAAPGSAIRGPLVTENDAGLDAETFAWWKSFVKPIFMEMRERGIRSIKIERAQGERCRFDMVPEEENRSYPEGNSA